ncbi:hypothetical protein ACA910_014856 [Epithemia clementina (nom. ined.)]
MVYDGTKSGLNAALFAPWFSLATVNTMLRSVYHDTGSADNDFGEMFLKFWLHPELRRYAGIDLTTLFKDKLDQGGANRANKKTLWEAWTRCAMGLSTSPYQATQAAQRVKYLALGDRHDQKNVFRWDRVELNLPGSPDYKPWIAWIRKVRRDGSLAADVHAYVDDLRETAPSEEEAWEASSRMAKASAYYGLLDAACKRRPPSKTPGAWAGVLVEAGPQGVFKMVSEERWAKTKSHIETLSNWAGQPMVDRKALERIRGFLVYVTLTYGS